MTGIDRPMRLYLINPSNSNISMTSGRLLNRYRVWKPLGLMTVAGLTPRDWEVTILDENLGIPEYARMPRPDVVGITAFTSQAPRGYRIAAEFRERSVPVIMGGIHASMCVEEASRYVDAVVTGEAESVWPTVLMDAVSGNLKRVYAGGFTELMSSPPARHDLLPRGYAFGVVQTTRGCPLNCHFCSVSTFNGHRYRQRAVHEIVEEMKLIREKLMLIVDDNFVGTRPEHLEHSKAVLRAMIDAKIGKKWVCQATVNIAEDQEFLELARRSGCFGVFIGFESPTHEGLVEIGKRYNIRKGIDPRASVERIHKHGIGVVGSYILGLDCDVRGIGKRIALAAEAYGIDMLNTLFLTPLPGTRLWNEMERKRRIESNHFPEDWQYYTLGFPVTTYPHFTWPELREEMEECWRHFYAPRRIASRVWAAMRERRYPLAMLIGSLTYRWNYAMEGREGPGIDAMRRNAMAQRGGGAQGCEARGHLASSE